MKIEIPERKKLVHQMTIPIRWGDMDVMGHVNNTNYFRYLEILRLDWLRTMGQVLDGSVKEGLVVINAFCTFHKQFEFRGDVLAKMYVSYPRRSSFESWATLTRNDDPEVIYASGRPT